MRSRHTPTALNVSMRRASLLLTIVGAMLLVSSGVVLAQQERTPSPAALESATPPKTPTAVIPDQYIVVLKDDIVQDSEQVTSTRARRGGQDPTQVANEQARRHGLKVREVYQNALKGYSAMIPEDQLQEVEDDPRVDFVEPDQQTRVVKQKLPYGMKKIGADTSSTRAGNGSGTVSNVNTYVIDTGLRTHSDLNVIDPAAYNAINDGKDYDCQGHGTHVAGTVAAKDNSSAVVSAAPGTPLTGVKVLDCAGSGTISGAIAGVEWVTVNAKKPAVANMSLSGGASFALDYAVQKSSKSGIFYTVAAGNDSADACTKSPARAGAGTDNGIVTVAATGSNDAEASFSNYGNCVDIWAPGVSISSTSMNGGTTTMSGTSMASPHVGGTGALYLSKNASATPAAVETQLKTNSFSASTKSKDGRAIKRLYAGKY